MIEIPQTYSQWVEVLDILREKTDDSEVLWAMQKGTIQWQSGVAERFAKQLTQAVNHRMNAASDKFQRDMNNARGQENMIVQALLALRKEMSFLTQCMDIQALPQQDRAQYCRLVREQADSMQNSLEESAKKDRSGKLSSIVRNHKVNVF